MTNINPSFMTYMTYSYPSTTINITNFRKNIYDLMEQTVKFNEQICVTTKNGNAVVLSEEDYNNLIETIYISSIPKTKEDIIKGLKEEITDCINEDKIEW